MVSPSLLLLLGLFSIHEIVSQVIDNDTLIYHFDEKHLVTYYCRFASEEDLKTITLGADCYARNKGMQYVSAEGIMAYPYVGLGSDPGFILQCEDFPQLSNCTRYVHSNCSYKCDNDDVVHTMKCNLMGPWSSVTAKWSQEPCHPVVHPVTEGNSSNSADIITGVIVAGAVTAVLVIIGGIWCFYKWKRRYQTHNQSSQETPLMTGQGTPGDVQNGNLQSPPPGNGLDSENLADDINTEDTTENTGTASLPTVSHSNSRTPSLPDSTAPSLPNNRTPSLPDSTTPSLPNNRTPSLPDSTTPSLPNNRTPSLPDSTTPRAENPEADRRPSVSPDITLGTGNPEADRRPSVCPDLNPGTGISELHYDGEHQDYNYNHDSVPHKTKGMTDKKIQDAFEAYLTMHTESVENISVGFKSDTVKFSKTPKVNCRVSVQKLNEQPYSYRRRIRAELEVIPGRTREQALIGYVEENAQALAYTQHEIKLLEKSYESNVDEKVSDEFLHKMAAHDIKFGSIIEYFHRHGNKDAIMALLDVHTGCAFCEQFRSC